MSSEPTARELRSQIRHWRRGRANARLLDVLGDAYVALFAIAMIGSAAGNVVLNVRRTASAACTSPGCSEARVVLPWVVTGSAVLLVVAVARLLGPAQASPALDSWLLTAPVDRGGLLRGRLAVFFAGVAIAAALPGAVAAAIGGLAPALISEIAVASAGLALALTGLAVLGQASGRRLLLSVLITVSALGIWAAMLALAAGWWPAAHSPVPSPLTLTVAAALLIAGGLGTAGALFGVTGVPRRELAAGGRLAPGVSGALAGLDLGLAYDVITAHQWRRRAHVRPRRGGPSGPMALVWVDLTRWRRRPVPVIAALAAVVVPYAVASAGGERVTFLVLTLTGFVAALPLMIGLRTLARTPGIERLLPFPRRQTRLAGLAAPGCVLAGFAVLASGSITTAFDVTPLAGLGFAVVGSLGSLAAATRWMMGRPPDYGRPLVATPTGAVPTNLYGSIVRGFDMVVITTAPVLIWPTERGAIISVLVSVGVIGYLAERQ